MTNGKHWTKITDEESYRLSQAEFKGATMQALKDIDMRVARIEKEKDNTRLISVVIAGIAGIVSGILGGGVWQK